MNRGSRAALGARENVIDGASMRPRFMNRGSRADRRGRAARAGSFNEAPIHESGKWPRPTLPQSTSSELQ